MTFDLLSVDLLAHKIHNDGKILLAILTAAVLQKFRSVEFCNGLFTYHPVMLQHGIYTLNHQNNLQNLNTYKHQQLD